MNACSLPTANTWARYWTAVASRVRADRPGMAALAGRAGRGDLAALVVLVAQDEFDCQRVGVT